MNQRRGRPRIGILTHNYPVSSRDRKDAGIFIYDFAQELSKHADVFIFCPDFGGKKEKYKKVPVTWFSWSSDREKFGNWKLFNPMSVYKFFKLIYVGQKEAINFVKKNKIDYCLCCWAVPSAIFGYRVKQVLNIPYSSWSLGSDVNKYSRIPIIGQLISLSMANAHHLYANSYKLCKDVETISNKKCDFMPAITDFQLKKVEEPKLKKGKFRFLYVGRLERVKGPDILLKAVSVLAKSNKNFEVNILGDGSMMNDLKEMGTHLESFVNFYGWAGEEVVGGYMKTSDCLLIPSRNESLPLVMIESSKVRLPVIATNVGDCGRMIKKYNIGVVVESENYQQLAKSMKKIMIDNSFKKKGKFKELTNDFSQSRTAAFFLSNIN